MAKLFFFLMIRRPPRSTPLPYTTLFRSRGVLRQLIAVGALAVDHEGFQTLRLTDGSRAVLKGERQVLLRRSEEHTSELQSRQYLVCRLLLEKKNITSKSSIRHSTSS